MILSYESGRMTEKKSYREALRLEGSVSPILSITGAGGEDNDRSAFGIRI